MEAGFRLRLPLRDPDGQVEAALADNAAAVTEAEVMAMAMAPMVDHQARQVDPPVRRVDLQARQKGEDVELVLRTKTIILQNQISSK